MVNSPVEDLRTGWVYRTEGAASQATPPPSIPLPPVVARAVRLPPPPAPKPASWLDGAMTMMTLPLIITAGIMFAPLALMWASRKSPNG